MARQRSRDGDAGESLVEVLLAIAILGITVSAVLGGLAGAVMASDMHRGQADTTAAVRDLAESLVEQSQQPGNWKCASAYDATLPSSYAAYTATVTASYWTGSSFQPGCDPAKALQKAALRVSRADGRATATLDVVLRKPCPTAGSTC